MYNLLPLNTCLTKAAAAKTYQALGWHVIPLDGKRPITPWTTDPPLSPQALAIIFDGPDPTFNLGIVMGKPSLLVGLDLDGQTGIDYLNSSLDSDASRAVFNTLSFTTPSGGARLLYQYDHRITSRSIRQNGKELIRVMTNGTQTVAPPSTINDIPYLWLTPTTLAPCPVDAILQLVASHERREYCKPGRADLFMQTTELDKVHRARRYLLKCDPAISGQGGHNHTFKVAVKILKGFALTFQEAFALIAEWNESNQPPWSHDELAHKLEDALKTSTPSGFML